MEFSVWHLAVIAIVVLVLFGGSKIPQMMRGVGQGIREFKEGMRGDQPAQPGQPSQPVNPPASTSTEEKK